MKKGIKEVIKAIWSVFKWIIVVPVGLLFMFVVGVSLVVVHVWRICNGWKPANEID